MLSFIYIHHLFSSSTSFYFLDVTADNYHHEDPKVTTAHVNILTASLNMLVAEIMAMHNGKEKVRKQASEDVMTKYSAQIAVFRC